MLRSFSCSVWDRASFKNMFGGGASAPPPAPTPLPPPTMPDPQSPDTIAAGAKAAATAAKGGRNSTVLTNAGVRAAGTLAGSAGSKLGAS